MVNVLRDGYKIPFDHPPALSNTPIFFVSYPSGSEKGEALDAAVDKMLQKGALEPASSDPGHYSLLFLVPKPTLDWRPVIDLSPLNKCIRQTPFKMETCASVLRATKKDDWMLSLDLKDAYFQVPVHPESRRFLRVVSRGIAYQFRVICFGLCTAPQVFTRVMAPVASILHTRGIRMLRYLDDWLILMSSEEGAAWARDETLHLCHQLGIVINFEKSDLIPKKVAIYLGMRIESSILRAFPTEKRQDALINIIARLMALPAPPAHLWQQVLGHLSSLCLMVPGGRRRMRSMQLQLNSCWNHQSQAKLHPVPLTPKVKEDLTWWASRDNLLQGRDLVDPTPDRLLYADASTEGWGVSLDDLQASGRWSLAEASLSINLLELRAIRLGLQQFEEELQNLAVGILSDNRTAVAYVKKEGGTHSASLNREAQLILEWAEVNDVSLIPQYIRGKTTSSPMH